MPHRIFIAINLPENIKKELSYFQTKWRELPCRWTKKENLHITLVFLGYLSEEELSKVVEIAKKISQRHKPFLINLNKILYAPPKKMPPRPPKFSEEIIPEENKIKPDEKFWWPRMIWVKGEKSEELGKLQKDLENSLLTLSIKESESRPYTPHITLGRIRVWEFRQIEPEERPEINEDINLSFKVKSIEVMESHLKHGGPEYTILQSCPLKS